MFIFDLLITCVVRSFGDTPGDIPGNLTAELCCLKSFDIISGLGLNEFLGLIDFR